MDSFSLGHIMAHPTRYVTPDQTATWAAAFVAPVIPVPQRPRPLRARRVLAMTVGDPD